MAGYKKIEKENLSHELHTKSSSPLTAYKHKVLGKKATSCQLLRYEITTILTQNMGGAIGYLLRKKLFAPLFKKSGKSLILGKDLTIRKPGYIEIGDNVAIDDFTMLDGCCEQKPAIKIGNNVIISKGCVIQAKTGALTLGDKCDIGAHTVISSISSITMEDSVLIAGNCYIGGARYNLDNLDKPIMEQGIYSRGPITIGKGSWVGAAATILDGVTIGQGCVIGAGAVVSRDIPDYAIVAGVPAKVIRFRKNNENA